MKIHYHSSGSEVADYIVKALLEALKGGSVLWLVPGGSNIAVCSLISERLKGVNLKGLTVTLTDERYGPVNHVDSNWRQLLEAGFDLKDARLEPVLRDKDVSQTIADYDFMLKDLFESHDYFLGFFGIGADGHTAGLLPHSQAIEETDSYAAGYQAENFYRLSMTPPVFSLLDETVAFATGPAKYAVLDALSQDVPIKDMPSQLLKKSKKFTLFRDDNGGEV